MLTTPFSLAARLTGTIGLAVGLVAASGKSTSAVSRLPVDGEMPSLGGATAWLNSPPLTSASLRGKAVLVDIWTYTCINWLRTLPYVRGRGRHRPRGLARLTIEKRLGHGKRRIT